MTISPRFLLYLPQWAVRCGAVIVFISQAGAYPGAPATWGTWVEDTYFALTPRQISATTDPDGRLRAVFINDRAPTVASNFRQAMMFTYRRADGGFRESSGVSLYYGLPAGTAYTSLNSADYVATDAMQLPVRTKVVTADRKTGFDVRASLVTRITDPGANREFTIRTMRNPVSFPYFPRKNWSARLNSPFGVFTTFATGANSTSLSAAGPVEVSASVSNSPGNFASVSSDYVLPGLNSSIGFTADFSEGVANSLGRLRSMDTALTDDGQDCYFAINTGLQVSGPNTLRSALQVFRQRPVKPGGSGTPTSTLITSLSYPLSTVGLDSILAYPKILLTHATGEPKWVVWSDTYNTDIRIAKRRVPTTGGGTDDPNNNRRLEGGYDVFPVVDTFAFAPDAALDRLDRLHLLWWRSISGQVVYQRENSSGTFDRIILPTPASGAPALAIGPGGYPYILYPGVATGNPGESAPLIVTMPPGLISEYNGDYEDRDGDGRCGLIERAQGSSDLSSETGVNLKALTLSARISTVSPGVRRFETDFQLALASSRVAGTTTWNLADGNDLIQIEPTYSIDG